jgi:hypothetical protein
MPPWPGSSGSTKTRPTTWTCSRNQADKWKALPDLTAGQRARIAAYEALIAQLRQVNSEVLAAADQLTRTTIEAVLAKSDLELGLEALLRGWQ